jgi:hypothetical protein
MYSLRESWLWIFDRASRFIYQEPHDLARLSRLSAWFEMEVSWQDQLRRQIEPMLRSSRCRKLKREDNREISSANSNTCHFANLFHLQKLGFNRDWSFYPRVCATRKSCLCGDRGRLLIWMLLERDNSSCDSIDVGSIDTIASLSSWNGTYFPSGLRRGFLLSSKQREVDLGKSVCLSYGISHIFLNNLDWKFAKSFELFEWLWFRVH